MRFRPSAATLTLKPDWTGPRPPAATPIFVGKCGVDLNPVNPKTDSLRLRAYLWPDQPERLALTDAALALPPARVEKADAIDWLKTRLPHVAGQTHMIYTTIAWHYFPTEKQRKGLAMIETAGSNATSDTPRAFVQMENDGAGNGAALTLRLWTAGVNLTLGRIDFHGRWVNRTA